jgi:UDP-N-acetylmuramoylalanine-D-glutamate ligase
VGVQDERFAPGITVTGSDVSSTPALLQEFLDQAQRDTKTTGNFFTVSFLLVVGTEDSFTQVQGYGSHERILSHLKATGYSFI